MRGAGINTLTLVVTSTLGGEGGRGNEGGGEGREEKEEEENLLVFIKGLCGCESCSVFRADYPEQVSSLWGLNGPQ